MQPLEWDQLEGLVVAPQRRHFHNCHEQHFHVSSIAILGLRANLGVMGRQLLMENLKEGSQDCMTVVTSCIEV